MSTPLRAHDPREVGQYQLLGRLGAGGMGAVLNDRSRTSGKISLGIDGRGDGKAAGGFAVTFGNVKVVTPS